MDSAAFSRQPGRTAALLGVLLLAACVTASRPAVPRALPVHENLHATLWMQSAVEYRAVALQTWALAQRQLEVALADTTWSAALEQTPPFAHYPPAVIVDVDETVLDNSAYQARLVLDGAEFDEASWQRWCQEAAARAVPGAAEFTRYAHELGVTVFYVTNRRHETSAPTRRNLAARGFAVDSRRETILAIGGHPEWDSSDKTSRRAAVAAEFRILLLIGDDLGDFVPAGAGPAERLRLADQHAALWGERWIMLPNPAYGSWERALSGYDDRLSRAEKLRLKYRRLELLRP